MFENETLDLKLIKLRAQRHFYNQKKRSHMKWNKIKLLSYNFFKLKLKSMR